MHAACFCEGSTNERSFVARPLYPVWCVSLLHQLYTRRGCLIPGWVRCQFPAVSFSSRCVVFDRFDEIWLATWSIVVKGKGGVPVLTRTQARQDRVLATAGGRRGCCIGSHMDVSGDLQEERIQPIREINGELD